MAGRPRSEAVDDALLAATSELLREVGYAATTVDAVARRAGVPKSSLYRRWPSRPALVFAAAVHPSAISVPDTGRLDTDLLELARRVVAALGRPGARQVLPGLLADLADDPALLHRFREEVIGVERALVRDVLDRAVGRGELATADAATELHAQLLGTAFAWTVLAGDPPADLAERLADAAGAVLTPRRTR